MITEVLKSVEPRNNNLGKQYSGKEGTLQNERYPLEA
jgi:hypothetical protein